MPFPLTDEQAYAVNTLNINCIVPAGAGSGKTRVLVERYVKIIEESQEIPSILEKIVAITFTEKAAREMKERIRKEMAERRNQALADDNMDKARLWQENIQRLERATISTIHSFCARILREFPIEAKLDPEFQVIDQTQMYWLLHDAVEKELKNQLEEERTKGISPLLQWVATSGFQRAVGQVIKTYHSMKNSGFTFDEIRSQTEKELQKSPTEWLIGLDRLLIEGEKLFHANADNGNKNFKTFQDHWPQLRDALIDAKANNEDIQPIVKAIVNVTSGTLGKGEIKEYRGKTNDQAKNILEQVKGIEHLELEKIVVDQFFPLFEQIDRRIRIEKEKVNGLDFDDLQLKVVELLSENAEIRNKLQKRYHYFMIDEFQDNNQVQKKLAALLLKDQSGQISPGKLFVVGDPKQSIYRFRGADVSVFKEMEKEILEMNGRVAPLKYNFRSHPTIIQFVNHLFQKIMSGDETSPNFYEEAIAKGSVDCKEDPIEFIPIYHDKDDEESVREKEADAISLRIQQLIRQGVQPREITILFRAMSNIKTYEQALSKRNIPYYVMGGRGFYQKQEIHDVIHVLRYLIDPSNKIALAGILRSPMVGVQDDTLYWIMKNIAFKEVSRWPKFLSELADEGEKQKIEFFIDWFTTLSEKMGRIKVDEIIRSILAVTHFKAIVLASYKGTQAVANLDKLIRLAEQFSGENPFSVYEFLTRFERLIEDANQETEAAIESEMGNTVKLMTIHQSKGLEFPFVFVPDLGRRPNNDDSLLRFDPKLGLSCKVPNEEHIFEESIRYHYSHEKEKQLEREESARVLYVAVTRAEKKLFLSGKVEESKNKEELSEILKETTWSKWLDAILSTENISVEDGIWPFHVKDGIKLAIRVMNDHLLDKQVEGKEEQEQALGIGAVEENIGEGSEFKHEDFTKPVELSNTDRHFSVSAIKRYQQCPRSYYFADRLSLAQTLSWLNGEEIEQEGAEQESSSQKDGKKLTPNIRGSIVHYVLEQLTYHPDQMKNWEEIVGTGLTAQKIRLDELNPQDWDEFLSEMKQYMQHYQQSDLVKQDFNEVWAEYNFSLPLKNGKLLGTIDRIEWYEDGTFSIVDYKTDKEMDVERYRSQILTYTLAVQKHLNKQPRDGKLYYLRSNQMKMIEINQEIIENWEAELEMIMEKINTSQQIEEFPKHQEHCFSCSFNRLCKKVT